jgi:thiol-disulfide isomerase/thioredoxin
VRALLLLISFTGCATTANHGTLTDLSAAAPDAKFCAHRVPADVCAKCHPELTAKFKAANDWCGEHDVPESQCFTCHPDLSFEPLPTLRAGADFAKVSAAGEDVVALEPHLAKGKVTVVDFYADWCAPCRRIDAHVFTLLNTRDDVALRKLNVVSWETPVARRYLANAPTLPHVLVYGRDGTLVRAVSGLDLAALDAAIAEGASR